MACLESQIPAAPRSHTTRSGASVRHSRTGSEDEQDHRDDDGKDESSDSDRAGVHGVSEPVGINLRPYSVSLRPALDLTRFGGHVGAGLRSLFLVDDR